MAATTPQWMPAPCLGTMILTFNSVIAFYNSTLRKTGENTFEPLSEQELARLSNVEMPESIEIHDSDNNDHHDTNHDNDDNNSKKKTTNKKTTKQTNNNIV